MANAPAIELRGVSKLFGDYAAVSDLTLTVPRGSVYGFIGPNGSGKTTTLRMTLNILLPDRGEIVVHRRADWRWGCRCFHRRRRS